MTLCLFSDLPLRFHLLRFFALLQSLEETRKLAIHQNIQQSLINQSTANTRSAALNVQSISLSPCADDKNPASNADGAK